MRTIMLTIIATSIVAATMHAAIRHGQKVADLEHQVAALELEVEARQVMLDDAHALYPLLERRVLQVETEYTAREIVWMLRDAFADCQNVEVH